MRHHFMLMEIFIATTDDIWDILETPAEKRGISDEQEALRCCLNHWEEFGLEGGKKDFASGAANPNMGDLSVFGTLHSIEGLSAHAGAVTNRGGVIVDWYQRMSMEVFGKRK